MFAGDLFGWQEFFFQEMLKKHIEEREILLGILQVVIASCLCAFRAGYCSSNAISRPRLVSRIQD